MSNDVRMIYKEIFDIYLNFSPHFRRNLVDLKEMYDWLDEIELRRGIFWDKYDFFILMEWFNAVGLIRPIARLSYPPETFKGALFMIDSYSSDLENLYKDGLISFPEDIYNTSGKNPNEVKKWQYRTFKPDYNDENDYRKYTEYDLDYYLFHPIQFYQLITYLRGSTVKNLLNKKEYKKFYWERRLSFKDNKVKEIEVYIKEKGLTKDQYINQECDKGIGFHQLEGIIYKQNRWLIEKALLLWIKFETLYHVDFLRPSNLRRINIELQISLKDSTKDDLIKSMFKEYYDWYERAMNNFSGFFSIEEFTILKGFREWTEVQLRINGLDNFKDLFLLIQNEKKSKLKGFLNFYVNILEIVKVLRFFIKKYTEVFPELRTEIQEPKWYEPKFFFGTEEEEIEYIQKVYLDYGLTQKDTYLLHVEGPTERILLEDWLNLVYYRVKVKINIKILLGGKSSASVFEHLAKNFNANEHFLILDEDKPGYAEGKKNQLNGKGISDDSFYIFSPDFITANFDPTEIVEAMKRYFSDISDKIYESKRQRPKLSESDLIDFKTILDNKEEFDKYEDLVEIFLSNKLQNPSLELKKTDFAQHLLSVMRENLSQTNRSKRYQFEEEIGKFVTKIQKKKHPGLDINT